MAQEERRIPRIPEELSAVRRHHRERLASAEEHELRAQEPGPFPWPGLLAGLVGIAALSALTPFAEGYLEASGLAATYLPTGVFLAFLLILGLNGLLARLAHPLGRRDVLLAYVTMLVPSAIPSSGFSLVLVPILAGMYHYATPLNEWELLHWNHVPSWMTPGGGDVAEWYFEGLPPGATIPWSAWLAPLSMWALFAVGLYLMMAALCVALRSRWIAAERLQFPLAQIPLEIVGDSAAPNWGSAFFRQPLMWAGAAIPIFIHTLNGLHEYFPAVPALVLTDLLWKDLLSGSRMLEAPFSQLGNVEFNFYPSIIGISYLLRSEVSLSVWLFEWVYRFEEVIFEATGVGHGQHQFSPLHTFGFTLLSRYQKIGATLFAGAIFLWAARGEIAEMFRSMIGRPARRDSFAVPPWALPAFLAGLAIYLAWTAATGMHMLAAVLLLVSFLLIAVVTARIVAATGLLWVYDYYTNMLGLTKVMGTARLDPHTFTIVGMVDYNALGNRANLMPMALDSLRISHSSDIREGHAFLAMALGVVVALVVSLATVVWLGYHFGGRNLEDYMFRGGADWLFNRVGRFQVTRVTTDWTVIGCMAAGAGTMAFLIHMHHNYLWWAVNPLGFVIGDTVATRGMWSSVFIGWALKALIMAMAGPRTYRRLRASAMGLVVGEFLCVGIWLAVDALTGHVGHHVFPDWSPD